MTCSVSAYDIERRWTRTAAGAAGSMGNPIHVSWGFALDGTVIPDFENNNIKSFFDTHFGTGPGGNDLTMRPWFHHFDHAFGRWSELSGVTFSYEANDDGTQLLTVPGSTGVRSDIRIGGSYTEGANAFGLFPDSGDIVLNTDNVLFFTNAAQEYRAMRNALMHEIGHAMGLDHSSSLNHSFLMELPPDPSFDGPQLDDIRGIHRMYGDVYEKLNPSGTSNDFPSSATHLGSMAQAGDILSVGTDASDNTFVGLDQVDFVSLDDGLDSDYFSFQVPGPATVGFSLQPLGPQYDEDGTLIDAQTISDLRLTILDTNGFSRLASADATQFGIEEIEELELNSGGTYYARVTGTASSDDVQLYRLDITAHSVPEPSGWLLAICLVPFVRPATKWRYHVTMDESPWTTKMRMR